MALGCNKPGILRPYCSKYCGGTFYCSEKCFDLDREQGWHDRFCRRCEGLENTALCPDPRLSGYKNIPRGQLNKELEHCCLRASRSFKRGERILLEVPFLLQTQIQPVSQHMGKLDPSGTLSDYINLVNNDFEALQRVPHHPMKHCIVQPAYKAEIVQPLTQQCKTMMENVFCWNKEKLTKFLKSRMTRDSVDPSGEGRAVLDLEKRLTKKALPDREPIQLVPKGGITWDLLGRLVFYLCSGQFSEDGPMGTVRSTFLPSYFGVFANSSCDANTGIYNLHDASCVVAHRDIQAGEELTYNYLHDTAGMTARERRNHIRSMVSYHCECEACRTDSPSYGFGESGSMRALIQDKKLDLFDLKQRIDQCLSVVLFHCMEGHDFPMFQGILTLTDLDPEGLWTPRLSPQTMVPPKTRARNRKSKFQKDLEEQDRKRQEYDFCTSLDERIECFRSKVMSMAVPEHGNPEEAKAARKLSEVCEALLKVSRPGIRKSVFITSNPLNELTCLMARISADYAEFCLGKDRTKETMVLFSQIPKNKDLLGKLERHVATFVPSCLPPEFYFVRNGSLGNANTLMFHLIASLRYRPSQAEEQQ